MSDRGVLSTSFMQSLSSGSLHPQRQSEFLDAIHGLEVPYVLMFNRGRLMALPTGVNKANGFREALRTLRLSPHNAIAIGDAENDFDLLEVCELGVAAGWGSRPLQQAADEILQGEGPKAVAEYIRQLAAATRLTPDRVGRRRLIIGNDDQGRAVSFAVRGRNLLVAGDPKSGKSWVAGLLCEQLIQLRYSICIIDPALADATRREVELRAFTVAWR